MNRFRVWFSLAGLLLATRVFALTPYYTENFTPPANWSAWTVNPSSGHAGAAM